MASEADRREPRALVGLAGLLVGLVIGVGGTLALVDGDDDGKSAAAGTGSATSPISVAAVAEEPSEYYRRDLWVAGVIGDVIGPRSLLLDAPGDEPLDDLLVITEEPWALAGDAGPATRPLLQGDRLWVHGELRTLDVAELEGSLDAQLEDDVEEREGEPVLLAETIELTAQLYPVGGVLRAREVAARPEQFFGQLGLVRGEVAAHVGSAAFLLGERLLVLNPAGEDLPAAGEPVEVLGPVRRFDLDQLPGSRRDDIDDDLFGEFIDQPVVVALEVRREETSEEQ